MNALVKFCLPFVVVTVVATLGGCGSALLLVDKSGQNLFESQKVYVQTNLHPDNKQLKLYSINYQREGLIPVCSEVVLEDLGRKRLIFTVKKTGTTYNYDHHRSAGEFTEHLKDYFGSSCDKSKVKKLSKLDQKGIKKGRASKGMSKQGVIYAIGYPPKHRTPNLDSDVWVYWVNRFKTMAVEFDESGKVVAVR